MQPLWDRERRRKIRDRFAKRGFLGTLSAKRETTKKHTKTDFLVIFFHLYLHPAHQVRFGVKFAFWESWVHLCQRLFRCCCTPCDIHDINKATIEPWCPHCFSDPPWPCFNFFSQQDIAYVLDTPASSLCTCQSFSLYGQCEHTTFVSSLALPHRPARINLNEMPAAKRSKGRKRKAESAPTPRQKRRAHQKAVKEQRMSRWSAWTPSMWPA